VPAASTDRTAHPLGGRALIGVVGYSPLPVAFPLGPTLMRRLEAASAANERLQVENMTWSPIHIVQRFQDRSLAADRLVLVGAADECREAGRITCSRWQGGNLPPDAVQERIYEAVTGIVSLDNTLLIGEQFAVWPSEVFAVELEMLPSTFGEIVMAEAERTADRASLLARLGFDAVAAGERLAAAALVCALGDLDAGLALERKSAASLTPHLPFTRTTVAARGWEERR
jgi:hypothetical protein